MKSTRLRSLTLYILIFCFFMGIGFFMYEFRNNAALWAFSPVNRHLSQGGMSGGKVFDTNGIILAQTISGKRIYCEDEGIRKALLHTVGDGCVLIPTSVQSRWSTQLFGYNFITGFGASGVFNSSRDVTLTLDGKICSKVSKSFKNNKGCAAAYNYLTGEIICMVSLPTYDVNHRPPINENDVKYEGIYLNRVLSSSLTPGSIFKIFTSIAALDFIKDAQSRTFFCNKTKVIDGEKVTCMASHGKIDLKNSLSKSCDIAFSDIALELGKEKMKDKMEELGFNKPQYFENKQVNSSEYKIDDASQADLGWSGVGQYKDLVNPLHILKIMGAVANHGTSLEPYVVKSISSGLPLSYKSSSKNFMSGETADKIKDMMRYTMKNQYKDSLFGNIPICAKTGTAEVGEGIVPHGWMVGFSADKTFPVAFAVVVENGDFGIKSAGPVASLLIKEIHETFKNN